MDIMLRTAVFMNLLMLMLFWYSQDPGFFATLKDDEKGRSLYVNADRGNHVFVNGERCVFDGMGDIE